MDYELHDILADGQPDGKLAEYMERHADDPFNVRDLELGDILQVLNGSYIARRFFGRSSSWLYQKLNGNVTNGKQREFTAEERAKLKRALDTLAWEIQELADDM